MSSNVQGIKIPKKPSAIKELNQFIENVNSNKALGFIDELINELILAYFSQTDKGESLFDFILTKTDNTSIDVETIIKDSHTLKEFFYLFIEQGFNNNLHERCCFKHSFYIPENKDYMLVGFISDLFYQHGIYDECVKNCTIAEAYSYFSGSGEVDIKEPYNKSEIHDIYESVKTEWDSVFKSYFILKNGLTKKSKGLFDVFLENENIVFRDDNLKNRFLNAKTSKTDFIIKDILIVQEAEKHGIVFEKPKDFLSYRSDFLNNPDLGEKIDDYYNSIANKIDEDLTLIDFFNIEINKI